MRSIELGEGILTRGTIWLEQEWYYTDEWSGRLARSIFRIACSVKRLLCEYEHDQQRIESQGFDERQTDEHG
jgi:hypothetical protein